MVQVNKRMFSRKKTTEVKLFPNMERRDQNMFILK